MANPFIENSRGYDGLTLVSCVHKALRRGDAHAALYFSIEMEEGGWQALLLSRLRIAVHEDLSPLDPAAFTAAQASLADLRDMLPTRKTGYRLALANFILTFCRTRLKGRDADMLVATVMHERHTHPPRPYPPEALDHHTSAGRQAGRTEAECAEESYLLLPEDHTDPQIQASGAAAFRWEKEAPGRSLDAKPEPMPKSPAQRRLEAGK